jgi:hypothetical protein
MFVLGEMNRLVGTGRDANAVEITLGLIHDGNAIRDGDGILGADEDAGAGAAALLRINHNLGHAEAFLPKKPGYLEKQADERQLD